jgi:signal transduction histidine kinase
VKVYSERGEARVEVRDRGIGISEENQKRIFQQFERVTAKHAVGGPGLGLFISEQIVTAHGGTIDRREPDRRGRPVSRLSAAVGNNRPINATSDRPHGRISSY